LIHDRHFEPMTLGLVPENQLESLAETNEPKNLPSIFRRLRSLNNRE